MALEFDTEYLEFARNRVTVAACRRAAALLGGIDAKEQEVEVANADLVLHGAIKMYVEAMAEAGLEL